MKNLPVFLLFGPVLALAQVASDVKLSLSGGGWTKALSRPMPAVDAGDSLAAYLRGRVVLAHRVDLDPKAGRDVVFASVLAAPGHDESLEIRVDRQKLAPFVRHGANKFWLRQAYYAGEFRGRHCFGFDSCGALVIASSEFDGACEVLPVGEEPVFIRAEGQRLWWTTVGGRLFMVDGELSTRRAIYVSPEPVLRIAPDRGSCWMLVRGMREGKRERVLLRNISASGVVIREIEVPVADPWSVNRMSVIEGDIFLWSGNGAVWLVADGLIQLFWSGSSQPVAISPSEGGRAAWIVATTDGVYDVQ